MNEERKTRRDYSILDGRGRVIGVASGQTAQDAVDRWRHNNRGVDYVGPLEAWRRGETNEHLDVKVKTERVMGETYYVADIVVRSTGEILYTTEPSSYTEMEAQLDDWFDAIFLASVPRSLGGD